MIDSDTQRFIQNEVKKQLNTILSGTSSDAATHTETINNLYPGMPSIVGRPRMHPYGFTSVPADGVIQVTARQGENPGNVLVLGHRDANKPADLAKGESAQYSLGGYQVRVLNDRVQIGKNGTFETTLMGETTLGFLSQFIALVIAHTHIGNMGAPTSPPQNASDFTELKSDFLDNNKLLCQDGDDF